MPRHTTGPKVKPSQRAALQRAEVEKKKKKKASARRARQRANRQKVLTGDLMLPASRVYAARPTPYGSDLLGLGLMFVGAILFQGLSEEGKERVRRLIMSAPLPFGIDQATPDQDNGREWEEDPGIKVD